ncbi:MAG: hypothetical protein ACKV19_04660 [Verrucomicrobiales bacterium]
MTTYEKLRPWTAIQACRCGTLTELLLVDLMTDNPIHCAICRGEVDPERLPLTDNEAESMARWYSVASALYRLWLDSGEYEGYAKQKLSDPHGQINQQARKLATALSRRLPTRFWYFHDADDGDPTYCPVCAEPLDTSVDWGVGICRPCHLQM